MERRGITARSAAMLLLIAMILTGLGACSDELLPPAPPEEGGSIERESLVFFNDFGTTFDPASRAPDLSTMMVRAVRPDGTGRFDIATGMVASSPRNGHIAICSQGIGAGGQEGIYIANDDGTAPVLVEPANSAGEYGINVYSVTLGPDGESLAWVAGDAAGEAVLHVKTPARVSTIALGVDFSTDFFNVTVPAFSPNGQEVAYASTRIDSLGGEILVVSAATGAVRRYGIPYLPFGASLYSPQYDWSPDGRRILYVGYVLDDSLGFTTELMVLDTQTGFSDTLTSSPEMKDSPRWLPSGGICYFGTAESTELYLREPSGAIRRLTFGGTSMMAGLSISPDGKSALYTEFPDFGANAFGNIRTFDLVRRAAGPILATNTDIAHWRR